jgi:GH25 family lysozyme M1 (1,4-beta-N-acetylmuramidase)
MLEGLDLSNNNSIDLAFEKQSRGLEFVIHKATEGIGFVDGLYNRRRGASYGLGLVWGAYHFAHPANDPITEARFFLGHALVNPGDLVALDLETTDGRSWSQIASWAETWLNVVQGVLARPVLLYSYASFLAALPTAKLTGSPLWIAEPGQVTPGYLDRWNNWAIHQYGQGGGYDQNHFNGGIDGLHQLAGMPKPPPSDPCPKRIPWNGPYPWADAPTGERAVPIETQGQTIGVRYVPC